MILTTEIFNSLTGKGGGGFNEVKTYLEIGVREGDTFNSRVPFISEKAVAIDCWDLFETDSQNDMGRSRKQAQLQYNKLRDKYRENDAVDVIRNFSSDMAFFNTRFEDGYFDMIFIDGDHSYEGVKEDLNNWWSKCNTLFCGHDYMLTRTTWNGVVCGVKQAVDEFIAEHEEEIKMFRVFENSANPTWFIWKK
jgi:hypothetical protein|tara:strand:+ start:1624 stop:2202 length:579 start_codon:yes stop_codon:yes gene_type:complete